MATIHDRMPVILPLGARDRWLDPTASEAELRSVSSLPVISSLVSLLECDGQANGPRRDPSFDTPEQPFLLQGTFDRLALRTHFRFVGGNHKDRR